MKLIIKPTMNIDIHLKLGLLIIDKISEKDGCFLFSLGL